MNQGIDITGALTGNKRLRKAGYTLSEKLKNKIKTKQIVYMQSVKDRKAEEADSLLKTQFVNELEKNAAVLAQLFRATGSDYVRFYSGTESGTRQN